MEIWMHWKRVSTLAINKNNIDYQLVTKCNHKLTLSNVKQLELLSIIKQKSITEIVVKAETHWSRSAGIPLFDGIQLAFSSYWLDEERVHTNR